MDPMRPWLERTLGRQVHAWKDFFACSVSLDSCLPKRNFFRAKKPFMSSPTSHTKSLSEERWLPSPRAANSCKTKRKVYVLGETQGRLLIQWSFSPIHYAIEHLSTCKGRSTTSKKRRAMSLPPPTPSLWWAEQRGYKTLRYIQKMVIWI